MQFLEWSSRINICPVSPTSNLLSGGTGLRAGEMIPEVEGTRSWGPWRKRVPMCIKGPKTTYTTIAVAEKQSKRSKKGPFSLYIGFPRSHPGDGINGARRGRSLPEHPGFSSHDWPDTRVVLARQCGSAKIRYYIPACWINTDLREMVSQT